MARQHIVENYTLDNASYTKRNDMKESESSFHITEGGVDKTVNARAVYTFPISRPGVKNLNNRIYPLQLWENVIAKHQGEGTFGLMNHPADDGSVKDVWCVWKNLRLSEDRKLMLCDAFLVGRYGGDVKEILEAGGKIGLSTSAFGDFEPDGVTLKCDTFELERVADFVFNPSAQVYGEQSGLVKNTESVVVPSDDVSRRISDVPKPVVESVTDEHPAVSDSAMQEKVDKALRLNVISMWKNAKEEKDVKERIVKSESVLKEIGDVNGNFLDDIKSEIAVSLEADRKAVEEEVMDDDKKVDEGVSLAEENTSLKAELQKSKDNFDLVSEKLKRAETLLDSMKLYSSRMKKNYQEKVDTIGSMVDMTKYNEALAYGDSCDEHINDLNVKISDLEDALDEQKKKSANVAINRVNAVKSEKFEMKKEIDTKDKQMSQLSEENRSLKSEVDEKTRRSEDIERKVNTLRGQIKSLKNENGKLNDKAGQVSSLRRQIADLEKQLEDVWIDVSDDDVSVSVTDGDEDIPYDTDFTAGNVMPVEAPRGNMPMGGDGMEMYASPAEDSPEGDGYTEIGSDYDDEKVPEYPDDYAPSKSDIHMKSRKPTVQHNMESTQSDVMLYYRDLRRQNPAVATIKEDILKCRSVLEAQNTFARLRGIVEMESRKDTPYAPRITVQEKSMQSPLSQVSGDITEALKKREGWV